jgi:hypothetical protein
MERCHSAGCLSAECERSLAGFLRQASNWSASAVSVDPNAARSTGSPAATAPIALSAATSPGGGGRSVGGRSVIVLHGRAPLPAPSAGGQRCSWACLPRSWTGGVRRRPSASA